MSKTKASTKKHSKKPARKAAAKKAKSPKQAVVSPTAAANSECPFRPGTLYGTLFSEGNKQPVDKQELIKKVASLTGKSEKVVTFAYQVLKSPKHRSNKHRSSVIEEGGKIKLIALRK